MCPPRTDAHPCASLNLTPIRNKHAFAGLTCLPCVQSRVSRLFIPVTVNLLRGLLRAGMRASAAGSTDVLSADNVLWEKKERFLVPFWRLPKRYPLAAGQRKLCS